MRWRDTMKWMIVPLLAVSLYAQEKCSMLSYASSAMETGTPFSVQCEGEVYTGTLITHPAKRFFRRGWLAFKFDQPVAASPKPRTEGKFLPSRGKQIKLLLMSGGDGIAAKDLLDGLSGAIFKSWYLIPGVFLALAPFEKGGDIMLRRHDVVYVQTAASGL